MHIRRLWCKCGGSYSDYVSCICDRGANVKRRGREERKNRREVRGRSSLSPVSLDIRKRETSWRRKGGGESTVWRNDGDTREGKRQENTEESYKWRHSDWNADKRRQNTPPSCPQLSSLPLRTARPVVGYLATRILSKTVSVWGENKSVIKVALLIAIISQDVYVCPSTVCTSSTIRIHNLIIYTSS